MRRAAATAPVVRARRSQAERTAETRARIVEAVVESIAEVGFQRTTATEIARRAGVTWGAVQHHFGGKDGMLLAVLEDSFGRFAERVADVAAGEPGLEERVGRFIDRAWEHFGSAHYRSTFEILLNHAGQAGEESGQAWQAAMRRAWAGVWDRMFEGRGLSRPRARALQYYTLCVLSGVASMQPLGTADGRARIAALDLLKETLVRELSAKG